MDQPNDNMPVQQDVTPPVAPTPTVVEQVKEKKSSNAGLIALIVVLLLLVFGLVGYILYLSDVPFVTNLFGKSQNQEETQMEESNTDEENNIAENEEQTEEPTTTEFTGESVSATLPIGWTIQEFYNGQGTEHLVSGTTYTGLTGLKILDGTKVVFDVEAVNGIGFVGCPNYYLFQDNSPAYQAEQQASVDEIGDTMNLRDYTTTAYTEFEWMGKTFRRIDKQLLYDTIPNNDYFEPPCFVGITTLMGLSFNDVANSYPGASYFFEISQTATDSELLELDSILASMSAI
jgi:hypothetical protein